MKNAMPNLSERKFTRQVLQFAKLRGWRTAHFRPARTARGWRTAVSGDGAGWPDLVLVRGERLLFAELKVGRNQLSTEQSAWLAALEVATGVPSLIWRPEDWPTIETTLE